MARLNDLPAAAESFDSLKRRFIRQNREIARANSIQSLRIRGLEAEVARLLAENVSLREEVISVNHELDRCRPNKRLDQEIDDIKGKLDAKLAELGGLLTDLGQLPRKVERMTERNGKPNNGGFQEGPGSYFRRSSIKGCRGSPGTDEGRLPAILEDRSYPRLSLSNADSTEDQDVNESVLDFERTLNDVPATSEWNNPWPGAEDTTPEGVDGRAVQVQEQPARRKRRDSSLLKDINLNPEPGSKQQDTSPPFLAKSGYKRKLCVRDEEDSIFQRADELDGFQFTRLSEASLQTKNENPIPQEPMGKPQRKERQPTRRALGPKSTNASIASPTKMLSSAKSRPDSDKESYRPPKSIDQAESKRTKATDRVRSIKQSKPDIVEIHLPEDVGPNEEVSCDPSELSAAHETFFLQPADPQQHLNDADTSSVPNPTPVPSSSARQSRRSRGPVSYAEPNLRDKMRRPTKDFADAVSGEDRFRRTSKPYSEGEGWEIGSARKMEQSGSKKKESDEAISSHIGPASPLESKQEKWMVQLPSNVMTDRKGRTLPEQKHELGPGDDEGPSTSSIAISTLIGGSKRRTHGKQQKHASYDIDCRQPPENIADDDPVVSKEAKGPSSRSRRAQSSSLLNSLQDSVVDAEEIIYAAAPVENETGKRRSAKHAHDMFDVTSQKTTRRTSQAVSANVGSDISQTGGETQRSQRAAAMRRRSMML
ncbi:hypothetical protein AJ80_06192 [Polytolypa hystricis UAMH7299]|uniref:Shugoshin N-terminal coiled-coil domain-containing protein n=1 Tax=Polytolypa hystricis (strain UAMH7299) TaxID=1447883 RepID=A0A2B7XPV2_POLH7|nr:hypothetical protein AJ80_06192 [Polytolypa hystricis UAMH7299]